MNRLAPVDPCFAAAGDLAAFADYARARREEREHGAKPRRSFGGCDARVAEFARRVVMPALELAGRTLIARWEEANTERGQV